MDLKQPRIKKLSLQAVVSKYKKSRRQLRARSINSARSDNFEVSPSLIRIFFEPFNFERIITPDEQAAVAQELAISGKITDLQLFEETKTIVCCQ